MRGISPDGAPAERTKRTRIADDVLRRERDRLIWDHRSGTGTRKGFGSLTVKEIASIFRLHPVYVHRILAREKERRRRARMN